MADNTKPPKLSTQNDDRLSAWMQVFDSIGHGITAVFEVVVKNPKAGISSNQYEKIKNLKK